MGRFYDIETLLKALRIAADNGQNWHATLAGTDPDKIWQKQTQELGLEGVVHFPGYLQGDELTACMSSAHIGLIPMNPASGVAVPYKAGDYLAHGLPVISSLPGELREMLETSGAGRFYRFGDPDDLFRVLRTAADDTVFRAHAPAAARSLFETRFNRETAYPLWAQWLEKIAP